MWVDKAGIERSFCSSSLKGHSATMERATCASVRVVHFPSLFVAENT